MCVCVCVCMSMCVHACVCVSEHCMCVHMCMLVRTLTFMHALEHTVQCVHEMQEDTYITSPITIDQQLIYYD